MQDSLAEGDAAVNVAERVAHPRVMPVDVLDTVSAARCEIERDRKKPECVSREQRVRQRVRHERGISARPNVPRTLYSGELSIMWWRRSWLALTSLSIGWWRRSSTRANFGGGLHVSLQARLMKDFNEHHESPPMPKLDTVQIDLAKQLALVLALPAFAPLCGIAFLHFQRLPRYAASLSHQGRN